MHWLDITNHISHKCNVTRPTEINSIIECHLPTEILQSLYEIY